MDIGIEKAVIRKQYSFGRFFRRLFFIILFFCFIFLLIIFRVQTKYVDKITDGSRLTPPNIGLVLGAGLKAKGQPSAVLEDRILTAIKLFQDGRVGKFIMSGDNSSLNHNEVQAMKNFALAEGLPESAIITDHAGVSTYDSCYRVKNVLGLNQVIVITQKYHLRRALYLCNELGVAAVGVPSENRGYDGQFKYTVREWLASVQAFLDINLIKPKISF